ncbi:MAG: glutamate--tRNA ligase [Elusimicrobia bacterium]|nr:glutamate--tRNA ligase [Elusimicrobiota bacterium]
MSLTIPKHKNLRTQEHKNVVVRFAPSPTGYLHIGGLRTALYNYLFAKHNKGKFLLRIEDTDRTRYVEGAVEKLVETLKWCGLECDENPVIQSERLDIYKEHVEQLLKNDHAYRCFCTPERLDEMRKTQSAKKQPLKYDSHCKNISKEESEKLSKEKSFTVRMKIPPEEIIFNDIIRDEVKFHGSLIDDQIILKSDGYPTYHLANVVDDHLMGITHVIRGEEWLSSTPKHIILYRYFGWEPPKFAHLPLLLNPDKSKLSKRQGDVAVEDYREKGYLPSALLNYIALLGWSTEDSQQIFESNELIEKFTLERCGKSASIFDTQKLLWMNGEYLRKMPIDELTDRAIPFINKAGLKADIEFLKKCISLEQEKIKLLSDVPKRIDFFLKNDIIYDDKAVAKVLRKDGVEKILTDISKVYEKIGNFTADNIEAETRKYAEANGLKTSKIFHPVRITVSGRTEGPSLFHMIELLGKEKTITRIKNVINKLIC